MKEQLKKRIAELTQAKEQHIANANACQGAINELNLLIAQIPEDPKQSEEK
jgi:hypothetical protein